MNYNCKYFRMFVIMLFLFAAGSELYAQKIPAWTRKLTVESWNNLTNKTVFKTSQKAPFLKFFQKTEPTSLVKTTDKKFIYSRVFHVNVFSTAEKELLLDNAVYPQAKLGQIAYLHNKHAAFFNTIIAQDISSVSQKAFQKHQNVLEKLFAGLETYYQKKNQEEFHSHIFSPKAIEYLQATKQPSAYVLSPAELNYFSKLPTLAAQREWVTLVITQLQQDIDQAMQADTFELKPSDFGNYYTRNIRLEYFQLLAQVLEHADKKRLSAIVRYKRYLPGVEEPLTDAQRAGYLQFKADTTKDPNIAQQIQSFEELDGIYAVAEAFELPYETALKINFMYAPTLLGEEEGIRLNQLPPRVCLDELTPKIEELDAQLTELQETASFTPQFYASYYQVYAKRQIYKTLAARAQFFLDWQNRHNK